jgi:beta-1,4-mannosyl-glycoprotein beta-1,4-N-acetylglucosaminyltransferase
MLLRIPHGYRARWHYLLTYLLHRWPRVLFILSTLYILLLINERKHPFTHHAHTISSSSIEIEIAHRSSALSSENHGFLPVETAQDFCYAHSFAPYTKRSKRRKVYDLFLLNTELDWLEVRLHTLSASVDYFIIVESPITFTGHQKPLILKENWERFKEFHSQIIHHVLEDPPQNAKRTWDVEDFQRNAMFSQVVPQLEGIRKAEIGDVLVVSDVDEIPRPATLVILRNCAVPKRVTIRSQFYYYGFQWRHRGEQWAHPQATLYNGPTGTILPADLRNGEGEWNRLNRWWEKIDIWNAGWHCSTCFETIEEVLGKLGAFSHVGLNQEVYRDRERIVERVRGGKDLWDREGEVFDRVEGNEDIPDVLKVDRKRWGYLLDRDGRNAGFKDYVKGRDTEK